jgi:hypothetical protein
MRRALLVHGCSPPETRSFESLDRRSAEHVTIADILGGGTGGHWLDRSSMNSRSAAQDSSSATSSDGQNAKSRAFGACRLPTLPGRANIRDQNLPMSRLFVM